MNSAIKNIHPIALNLILTVLYFLIAKGGLYLATLNQAASPVWPAAGFAISILYIFGIQSWYVVAIGAFVTNLITVESIPAAAMIAVGNTLEAIVGAYVISKLLTQKKLYSYQTEAVSFIGGAIIGSMVSASIGLASLYLFKDLKHDMLVPVFSTWWIGNTIGTLVVAPLLILFRNLRFEKVLMFPMAVIAVGGAAIFSFVFFYSSGGAYLFLLFPILLYALRALPASWILFVSFLVCVASITATVMGFGPYTGGQLNDRLIQLQLFLASLVVTALVLYGFSKEKFSRDGV